MATFVIVHGAWSGAWAWNRFVAPMLRKAGHEIYAVTLTGLGERSHIGSPDTDLDTHVADVVNVLTFEDLHDVILVGHSYGGMVITGVADRSPERLSQLVYLDAFVPADGSALFDYWTPEQRQDRLALVERDGEGWRIPPGPMQADDPSEIIPWAKQRRVGQPVKTFTEAIHLTRGETALPRAYVYCSGGKAPDSPFTKLAARVRVDPRWRYFELPSGHNLQYSAPEKTVEILLELAAS